MNNYSEFVELIRNDNKYAAQALERLRTFVKEFTADHNQPNQSLKDLAKSQFVAKLRIFHLELGNERIIQMNKADEAGVEALTVIEAFVEELANEAVEKAVETIQSMK